MTTFDSFETAASHQARFAPRLPDFIELWEGIRRHFAERRTFAELSRLSPRRLTDMGFDPSVVYDAVKGTWDEVSPGRYRDDI